MKKITVFSVLFVLITYSLQAQTRKEQVWKMLRSKDFILAAGVDTGPGTEKYFSSSEGFDAYPNAGLKSFFTWKASDEILQKASSRNLTWIGRPPFDNFVRQAKKIPGAEMYYYVDEPYWKNFQSMGDFYSHAIKTYPNVLYTSSLIASYAADPSSGVADKLPPDGQWKTYVKDYVDIAKPDVLIWNYYPFPSGRSIGFCIGRDRFNNGIYDDLMHIRSQALQNDIPYGAWSIAFGAEDCPFLGAKAFGFRFPSESDFRYHAFMQLAAGFNMLLYFNYASPNSAEKIPVDGFIDQDGNKKRLYYWSQTISPWVRNMGNETNMLRSNAVHWVKGKHSAPAPLTEWSRGLGNSDIVDFSLINPKEDEDLLIGFFESPNGTPGKAFMVVNTNQNDNRAATGNNLRYTIKLEPNKKLWKLNKSTAEVEEVNLTNSSYTTILEAGTGELFYTEVSDYDNDGIPNWYERKHGLDFLKADATADKDGDCFTNLEEYQNNTNPVVFNVNNNCIDIELAPIGTTVMTNTITQNGWTYYEDPNNAGKYLFAIEKQPQGTGANTQNVEFEVTINNQSNIYKAESNANATYALNRYWNIKPTTGSTNGYVNVRFYYDTSNTSVIESTATNFKASKPSSTISPLMAIYTKEIFDSSNLLISSGFKKSIYPAKNGTDFDKIEDGINYVQYNGIELTNQAGGSLIQAVVAPTATTNCKPGTIRYNRSSNKLQGCTKNGWVDFH